MPAQPLAQTRTLFDGDNVLVLRTHAVVSVLNHRTMILLLLGGDLSRLGNGERNLSRQSGTKVASRPSERARASPRRDEGEFINSRVREALINRFRRRENRSDLYIAPVQQNDRTWKEGGPKRVRTVPCGRLRKTLPPGGSFSEVPKVASESAGLPLQFSLTIV